MIKHFIEILQYWQPVLARVSIYISIAFFTTFLEKTEKLTNFTDFNLWMWFRTMLFCTLSSLLIVRTYIDNSLSDHKIKKFKSGDTEHLSKSDIESIRRDLGAS